MKAAKSRRAGARPQRNWPQRVGTARKGTGGQKSGKKEGTSASGFGAPSCNIDPAVEGKRSRTKRETCSARGAFHRAGRRQGLGGRGGLARSGFPPFRRAGVGVRRLHVLPDKDRPLP